MIQHNIPFTNNYELPPFPVRATRSHFQPDHEPQLFSTEAPPFHSNTLTGLLVHKVDLLTVSLSDKVDELILAINGLLPSLPARPEAA